MGRSALHLAVDSENLEAIELLLGRVNFHAIEEALLHAISKVSRFIIIIICYMIENPVRHFPVVEIPVTRYVRRLEQYFR